MANEKSNTEKFFDKYAEKIAEYQLFYQSGSKYPRDCCAGCIRIKL